MNSTRARETVLNGVDGGGLGNVAMAANDGVQFRGERFDALLQRVTLIGECQFRALVGAGFRDAPCDGFVVGEADNEASLAFHETRTGCHGVIPKSTVIGVRRAYRTANSRTAW